MPFVRFLLYFLLNFFYQLRIIKLCQSGSTSAKDCSVYLVEASGGTVSQSNLHPFKDFKMDAVRRQYKRRVEQDVNSAGLSINRPNRVSYYQSLFQRSSGLPVFLQGPNDKFIYRSCMVVSAAGIGICLASIYLMASGNLKKKQA